jgi:hypothetical protein
MRFGGALMTVWFGLRLGVRLDEFRGTRMHGTLKRGKLSGSSTLFQKLRRDTLR